MTVAAGREGAPTIEARTSTLKRAAAALEWERVPFPLGGGLGCSARGGPPSGNDVDLTRISPAWLGDE